MYAPERFRFWPYRKVWSKYFSTQEPPADSPRAQIKVLRTLLAELGMDGRLSMEKAKKLKEKREFEEEMKAIGAGVSPIDDDEGGRRTRRARGGASGSRRQPQEVSESEEDEDDSEHDAKSSNRRGRRRGSEDDSGDESETGAPPKKVSLEGRSGHGLNECCLAMPLVTWPSDHHAAHLSLT